MMATTENIKKLKSDAMVAGSRISAGQVIVGFVLFEEHLLSSSVRCSLCCVWE